MMFGQAPVGLPQAQALPGMPTPQFPTAPDIQKPKSGMFGSGKVQIDLGRAIAGYLAGIGNPAGAMALRSMDEQRQRQYEASQYQQRHQQELQDQMSLYDHKAAHAEPDDFTQRVQALEALKPGLGMQYAQTYASNGGGSMIQFVDPSTGQRYAIPQPSAPSLPQVGSVMDDPRKGGQAATPPAMFPRSY